MKILAIGAHFDDLELECGGTLALAIKKGWEVQAIVVSSSDYTDFNGKVLRTKTQASNEGIKGLRSLGVKLPIICLDYPTKQVPYDYKIVEQINKIITEFKPDLILTHWLYDNHHDHANTAKAVLTASRYQKNVLMFEPSFPSNLIPTIFKPMIYIDISSVINTKLKALKCHKSQYKKYWTDLVTSKARLRGIEIQAKYAEALMPLKYEVKL